MRTLPVVMRRHTDMAQITAKLRMKDGTEHWMCNPFDHLRLAMGDGDAFLGHEVASMQPRQLIVNPTYVQSIVEASR